MKESVCSSCSSLYWGLFENGFRRAEKGAECEFEGKKAEETAPRKSTPRTLKEVGQQYPGVIQNTSDLGKWRERC
jgi:hypothetical protein